MASRAPGSANDWSAAELRRYIALAKKLGVPANCHLADIGTHRRDTSLPRHASLITAISSDTEMGPPAGAGSTDADTRGLLQRVQDRADDDL
jgi:hypothetical protein